MEGVKKETKDIIQTGKEDMRAHVECQVKGIKNHVDGCIGKIEEDKDQRKIEEVEEKFKGRVATSRRGLMNLRID
ncbi:hypothetical protein AVEN_171347-1 [Araneus ventricosus]|uniref:Uncharacterized protein n=1 Tax=Araneus ventricosus TaxID=182803 RepID=A0A4Y2KE67_ARAVE|nr:hypothetical protein AVEN_171347-1 [Araneus ventricosus]